MESIKVTEINGIQLYYSFISGAQRIFENQKLLNKINVFPVADADTGTNLASTMRSIVNTAQPQESLKLTAVALADAALIGARGNSGIIFAQFLYGFSNEIKDEATLTVSAFAEYMNKAVRYAYEAIANPVEGTMISVIKDWAEYIYLLKDKFDDFLKLLLDGLMKAMESLKLTTTRMAVLAKANVVDAGAKGFVVFLEGMFDYFKNGQVQIAFDDTKIEIEEATNAINHDDITFRFCTEAMIKGENLTRDAFTKAMEGMGDSVVIAGSPTKMRIHIHTDQPWLLFEKIAKIGTVTYKKVDDMVMQNDLASNRKFKIGIVTDSTCDIPNELLQKYQIQVVPLTIHFGEEYFLDRITLQPEQFFKKLQKSDTHPTTAQPAYSTKLFNVGTEPVMVDIPLKAYQLTTDILVSTVGDAIGYEIVTPVILKANAEAGATIQVKYTPTVGTLTNANLTIKGGGLTDFRYIQMIARSSTGLKETKMNATIVGKTNAINIAVECQTNLEVFTCDGKLIINKKISGNAAFKIISLTFL